MRFLCVVLLLAGCGADPARTASYDIKQSLLAADMVVVKYLAQEPCAAGVARVDCVDPVTKTRLKVASRAAFDAVKLADGARAVAGSPLALKAAAAVMQLANIVPTH